MPQRRRVRRSREQIRAMYARMGDGNVRQIRRPRPAPMPQAHQLRVVKRVSENDPRLLAFHSLGSGKTLTGLLTTQEILNRYPGNKALFITPAGLTKNMERERKKHRVKLDPRRVTTLSYDKTVRRSGDLAREPFEIAVADEAHRLRNTGSRRYQAINPLLQKTPRVLFLSGSPLYNKPSDLGVLVNILAKERVLPETGSEFKYKYVESERVGPGFRGALLGAEATTKNTLKNTDKLRRILRKYVDYYEPGEEYTQFYPRVSETTIKVPLAKHQERVYNYLEDRLPRALKTSIRMNLPADKKTSANLNAFATGVRQAANSSRPFTPPDLSENPKIDKAVQNLTEKMAGDKNFRGLVYSNYLEAGVNPYKDKLDDLKIKYGTITGSMSAKEREKVVADYNAGKLKVLLLSSAGGEGLDLKGTKLIQILEPHWNDEKIRQVIGRGVRYKSHEHLAPEDRQVQVEHYMSTVSPRISDRILRINPTSIDEYLHNLSQDKSQIHHQLKDLMREASADYRTRQRQRSG